MADDSIVHLGRRLDYRGRKFGFTADRLRLPNGVEGEFETIRHPGGAMVIPIWADGRYALVRQFRYPVTRRLLEFPAGTLEPEEAPETTIRRELEEELGHRAREWHFLAQFPLAPGYSDEYIHAFLARDLEPLAEPPPGDADEDITTELLTPAELDAAMRAGEVDAKTMAGIQLIAAQG